MKKCLLIFAAIICSICTWGQSSVVMMGKAVTQSNNFTHAETMLVNDGLSIDKTSKSNSANCVVLTNSSNSSYDVLYVYLYKKANSKKVDKCRFVFNPNGKHGRRIGADLVKLGYTFDGSGKPNYRELYSNGNLGCGLDINSKGWMEATFLRYDN